MKCSFVLSWANVGTSRIWFGVKFYAHTHLPPKLKTQVWERLYSIVSDYKPGNYKYGKHDILDLKKALDIVYESLHEYYGNRQRRSL